LEVPKKSTKPSRVPRTQEEISFLLSPPNLQGELKLMHQMQWQEHTKCSNPSLPNPTKATYVMEGYERKNKEEIHKELQDLDPIGSPHLEKKVIGGNVDLDLLSLFPQKDARNMGERRREGKLSRSTMEEREAQKRGWLKEEEGVFIGGENMAVGSSPPDSLAVSPAPPD
jgi:hypothetical protein